MAFIEFTLPGRIDGKKFAVDIRTVSRFYENRQPDWVGTRLVFLDGSSEDVDETYEEVKRLAAQPTATITKAEAIGALRDATIDNYNFDVRDYSQRDAEILRMIADLIDRELASLKATQKALDGKTQQGT